MSGGFSGGLSSAEQQRVRFWVDALLRGAHKAHAAGELHAIGIRTRGGVRTRGSPLAAAPSRFPAGTPVEDILKLLQEEASPDLRKRVAAAMGEWGGGDALPVLCALALGARRDGDSAVRCAALDAIALIGGPESVRILEEAATSDADSAVAGLARSLAESVRRNER